jgi:hypothetical protein
MRYQETSRATLAAVAAGLVLLVGCAGRAFESAVPTEHGNRNVGLRVINDHAEDVRVYLIRGSTRVPVGSVGSFTSRTFKLSAAVLGPLPMVCLAVEAVGSHRNLTTIPVDVSLGQMVEARLGNRLRFADVAVRY